jgi:hypothetical protein
LAARTLAEAHRAEGERQRQAVARAITESADDVVRSLRLIDQRELRGWPTAGRGICGAINDTIPGANLGLFDE